MSGSYTDKSVLITGGASGIGLAAARLFAIQGAKVAIVDRSLDAAEEAAMEIKAGRGTAIAIGCDVSKAGDVERAVARTVEAFGRLDCAFNNAGIHPAQLGAPPQALAEISTEVCDALLAINLKGVFLCMKYELQQMEKQGSGAIVNTSSIAAVAALQNASVYSATKHGVMGLTRTAALEYATMNIRVNAVAPGFIDTPMLADPMRRRGEQIVANVPLKRLGMPEDIARTVLFLCSDDASYVNGASYRVDGGFLAGR